MSPYGLTVRTVSGLGISNDPNTLFRHPAQLVQPQLNIVDNSTDECSINSFIKLKIINRVLI